MAPKQAGDRYKPTIRLVDRQVGHSEGRESHRDSSSAWIDGLDNNHITQKSIPWGPQRKTHGIEYKTAAFHP